MFELEQVCEDNLSYYRKYEDAYQSDLKQYQSRIYPSKKAEQLRWYHIKSNGRYIGAIWLEKNPGEDFAILGIFIIDHEYRNKGIGKAAIQQIISDDLQLMNTGNALLRVREENNRAINCYEKAGFTETRRYSKGEINIIEMVYAADKKE